jgi:hypothetical protein
MFGLGFSMVERKERRVKHPALKKNFSVRGKKAQEDIRDGHFAWPFWPINRFP